MNSSSLAAPTTQVNLVVVRVSGGSDGGEGRTHGESLRIRVRKSFLSGASIAWFGVNSTMVSLTYNKVLPNFFGLLFIYCRVSSETQERVQGPEEMVLIH